MKKLFLFLLLTACSQTPSIHLSDATDAFRRADLPFTEVVVYDEETDPNHLLGRPNQYIEKMNFSDSRITSPGRKFCSVEIFHSAAEAEDRKSYIDLIGKGASVFAEYSVVHKNVLLRIDKELTPEQFEDYKRAIQSL
jgi:hypothetical protein